MAWLLEDPSHLFILQECCGRGSTGRCPEPAQPEHHGAILAGALLCPSAAIPPLAPPAACSAQLRSLHKLQQPWLLSAGGRQVTHLGLEALQPHDVLAAGGILLPKVLPEGVDLQGELPLHLRRLQGDTSWIYSTDAKQPSPPAQGHFPRCNF